MGIIKNNKVNLFIFSSVILAALLCFSSQVQAAQEEDYTYVVTEGNIVSGRINPTNVTFNVSKPEDIIITILDGNTLSSITDGKETLVPEMDYRVSGNTVTIRKAYVVAQSTRSLTFNFSDGASQNFYISIGAGGGAGSVGQTMYHDVPGGKIKYFCTGSAAIVVGYTGSPTEVSIPDTLGGFPVTTISGAFNGCSSLTRISIPESVTAIGYYAFAGCDGLTSITLPQGVTSIGGYAFAGCSGLTDIAIPQLVTNIGNHAFEDCLGLTSINVDTNNSTYSSIDGVLYNQARNNIISCPGGLTSISIPQGVTRIGDYAFAGCKKLTSITIPQEVTNIGDSAFSGCSSLTSIIADRNNSIYASVEGVLYNKAGTVLLAWPGGLTNITIPPEVTSIGYWAFADNTSLSGIVIPQSVTSIGSWAFAGCTGLTGIDIPVGVTSIRNYIFSGCSGLTSMNIPGNVTSISDDAFEGCSNLSSINVDNNNSAYTSFNNVLYNKARTILLQCPEGLTSVSIPQEVTGIGDEAFYNCSGLTSIDIPEGVSSIGAWAFRGCTGLTSITFKSPNTTINEAYGYTIPTTAKIIGYDPSTAKDYAIKYGRTFQLISVTPDECFIATAAFGSKLAWPVALLRQFRDQYLLSNAMGTAFVNFYYKHSPPIADFIVTSRPLKMLVRVMLAPVIAIVYILYHPILITGVLGLLIVFLTYRFRLREKYVRT